MPISQENFNKALFDLLHTQGYNPVPIDSRGKTTSVPNQADVFKISLDDDTEHAYVTIDDAQQLKVYYDDSAMNEETDNSEFRTLTRQLKKWAQRKQLGFELVNRDHLQPDMAMREHMKQKKQLGEAYFPMGKKASYNDSVPQVKIILQHTRQIEEGEQRFRNIAKIFVENTNGERFLVPTTRPGIARVYARHVAEGGTPYDEKGAHITSLVEEYTKMAGFVRATRNGQFNESAQKLVNEGINHYQNLRETLSKMTSHRGYNAYFESYTPVLNEESEEVTNLNELFVQETLDPRIESVLPILTRLSKNISEMSEVKELDEWAQSVLEVEDQTTKTLSVPADKMLDEASDREAQIRAVTNSVMHRIQMQAPELLKDLDNLEMAVADAASFFVGDGIEEIGSSDISALVKDVKQRMEERHADINEAGELSKGGHKYSEKPYVCVHAKKGKFKCHADTSYEAAKKAAQKWGLKSTAGIDVHLADVEHTAVNEAPGAETLAHNQSTEKSNLKAFDLAEEEMDESALQAYLGKKKYGEKGMKALQKAGRDHASPERMEKIRKKFNKMDEAGLEEEALDEINLGKAGKALAATAGLAAAGIGGEHMAKMPNLDQLQNQPGFAYELTQNLAKDPKYRESMQAYYDALNDPETSPMRKKLANQYNSDQYFRVWMDTIDQAKAKQPTTWNKIKNFVKSAFSEGIYEGPADEPVHPDKDADDKRWDDVEEGLDANQKRVGQLGPTEKVAKNSGARGKLVGASESVELDRIKALSGIK